MFDHAPVASFASRVPPVDALINTALRKITMLQALHLAREGWKDGRKTPAVGSCVGEKDQHMMIPESGGMMSPIQPLALACSRLAGPEHCAAVIFACCTPPTHNLIPCVQLPELQDETFEPLGHLKHLSPSNPPAACS